MKLCNIQPEEKFIHTFTFLEPGKGMSCGQLNCNRYADCHATISSRANQTSLSCRCLPSFKGDGITNCVPLGPEGKSEFED